MMLRFTISKAFTLRQFQYSFSQALKHPIMDSKSLLIGPRSNAPERQISKLFSTTRSHIEKLEYLLQTKQSELLNKFKIEELVSELGKASQQNPDITQFLEIYRNLVEAIQKSQINNNEVYKIIGWYNMISLKKKLVQKLLGASEDEIPLIIQSLSWMQTPQQNVESLFQTKEIMIDKLKIFFKKMPSSLSIDQLRKIDETINKQLHYLQRKYIQKYLAHHLDNLLRNIDSKEESKLMQEAIWLFEKSVKAMNDNEVIISKIEKFIQMKQSKLSNANLQKLMNIYRLTGRINIKIYRQHIKPNILSNRMNKLGDLVKNIEFIICSQIQDYYLLNDCFDRITVSFQHELLTQQEIKKLHFYTHYLKTKKQTIDLPLDLQIKMKSTCKSCNKNHSISSLVIKDKSVKPKLSKIKINFISECLYQKQTNLNILSQNAKKQFIDQYGFKLIGFNFKQIDIYEQPTFCGIQLAYILHQKNKNQFINIQPDCQPFTFTSGRFQRQSEIKNQMLAFYGIKTMHLNAQRFISRGKISEDEQIIFFKTDSKRKK